MVNCEFSSNLCCPPPSGSATTTATATAAAAAAASSAASTSAASVSALPLPLLLLLLLLPLLLLQVQLQMSVFMQLIMFQHAIISFIMRPSSGGRITPYCTAAVCPSVCPSTVNLTTENHIIMFKLRREVIHVRSNWQSSSEGRRHCGVPAIGTTLVSVQHHITYFSSFAQFSVVGTCQGLASIKIIDDNRHRGGGYVISVVCQPVILSFCMHDYAKVISRSH